MTLCACLATGSLDGTSSSKSSTTIAALSPSGSCNILAATAVGFMDCLMTPPLNLTPSLSGNETSTLDYLLEKLLLDNNRSLVTLKCSMLGATM